jgi:hypothetical protein
MTEADTRILQAEAMGFNIKKIKNEFRWTLISPDGVNVKHFNQGDPLGIKWLVDEMKAYKERVEAKENGETCKSFIDSILG